jgi:FkbM family methyltransferase
MPDVKEYQLNITRKTRILNKIRSFFISTGIDRILAKGMRISFLNPVLNKLVPPNYLYRHGTIRAFTVKGIKFQLDISDTVGHSNYFAIHDEGHSTLYKLIKPGMVIYDIGANVGSTSLNMAKLTGSTGKVFAFEPDSTNYKTASLHFKLNNTTNIQIFNTGLGDEKRQALQYNVNEFNRGMMRILPPEEAVEGAATTEVQVDTLDNIFQNNQVSAPHLMKIDVEGFEFRVLKGARQTILKYKPTLFIELDDRNLREQQSSASELVGYLEGLGYMIKNAADNQVLTSKSEFANCHIDILCTAS